LDKNLKGRTFNFEFNSCFVNMSEHNDRTIAHEIGHAVFGFAHPNQKMPAMEQDGLQDSTNLDFYNFMNSGDIYINKTTHEIDEYQLRKYQWNKVHSN